MAKVAKLIGSRITTYSGQGAAAYEVDQKVHTIAYTGDRIPDKLPGETKMWRDPIRIVPMRPGDIFDPRSRINLGETERVKHNSRVKEIGYVDEESLPKLLGYMKAIKNGE